jgi:hypothetical protein
MSTHTTSPATDKAPAAYPPGELRHRATEIAAAGVAALRREAREQTQTFIAGAGVPGSEEAERFTSDLLHSLTNLNADSLLALCADDPTLFTATPPHADAAKHPSAFTLVMKNLRGRLREVVGEEIGFALEDAAAPPWPGAWELSLETPDGHGTNVPETAAAAYLKHAWKRKTRTPRITNSREAALAASLGWEVRCCTGNVFHRTLVLTAGTPDEEARRLIREYREETAVRNGLNYRARQPNAQDDAEEAQAAA